MRRNVLLQTALDDTLDAINDSNVSQHHAVLLGLLAQLVKLGIVLLKLGDELVSAGNVGERSGDEGLGGEGGESLGESGEGREGGGGVGEEAREDRELARDVRAGEVVGRVRLLRSRAGSARALRG